MKERKKDMEKDYYSTPDLPIAGFLTCNGIKLLKMTDNGNGRKFFIFEGGANTEKLVYEYLNGGRIPAREFWDVTRNLKSLILR